jgi:histidine phosphotransferase ChpT
MTSNDPILFASLLSSRLCHDMMGPVGAVMNAVELLDDEKDPKMRARCLDLLADSARASADRLKFFRLAFGASGSQGEDLQTGEVRAALEGVVRAHPRVSLTWMVEEPVLPKESARMLLILGMIALDAVVRGGQLLVAVEGGDVVVRAEGARIMFDAEIRSVLAGEEEAIVSRTSPAWLVLGLARENGQKLQIAEEEGVLVLAAVGG